MTPHHETLLWQGRPNARPDWSFPTPMHFGIGLAALGGPLTPMLVLRGGGSAYWLLCLPVMAVGAWLLFGAALWDALRRWRTVYYLSDTRLVIDTRWPWGVRRSQWPLSEIAHARQNGRHVDLTLRATADGSAPLRLEYLDDAAQTTDQVIRALQRAPQTPETMFRD